jgi:hypothetical protein
MAYITKTPTLTGGALIGYLNLLTSVSVTGDASGSSPKALLKNTFERWRPDNVATVARFGLSSDATVNYVGIAGHNLAGQLISIGYATTVGGAITEIQAITPTTNAPIMVTLADTTVREITITATFAGTKEIAVIYAGEYLEMPRAIYGGHSPITLNAKTEYQSSTSETGQFLGRNIVKQGLETNFTWRYLDPAFVRGDFLAFMNEARQNPFFIDWRPDKHTDIAYGFIIKDIKVSNMGGAHGLMSATMSIRAHDDV